MVFGPKERFPCTLRHTRLQHISGYSSDHACILADLAFCAKGSLVALHRRSMDLPSFTWKVIFHWLLRTRTRGHGLYSRPAPLAIANCFTSV